ncbi:MAG: hypothetical protein AABW87_01050 [Nanoarchaeota archaeon]
MRFTPITIAMIAPNRKNHIPISIKTSMTPLISLKVSASHISCGYFTNQRTVNKKAMIQLGRKVFTIIKPPFRLTRRSTGLPINLATGEFIVTLPSN